MSTDTTERDETQDGEEATKPLNLTIEVAKVTACRRHVRVAVAREDVDRYFEDRFDKLAPEAEVPGFRAGKAPRQLVESRFRKQVAEQVKGALLMDSLSQINAGDHFSAISEPDLDYEKVTVPETGDFRFEFDIEVRPDFATPDWKGIRIKRPEREITDKEVERYLETLGSSSSVLVPVDEPAAAGDTVVCRVTTSADGQPVNFMAELPLRLRPVLSFGDTEIEGFDQLMAGVVAGDERTAEVTISQFSDNAEYQGRKLAVRFEVLDVKRTELSAPESLAGKYGFDNVGDLKDYIRDLLKSQLAYEQRQAVRNQISQKLTESASWELPAELLKKQFRRELQRSLMELKSSGFSPDEVRNHENRLRQDAMRRTETLLKEHFILERIAEEEKIEESPEDFDREIERMAKSSNESTRKVRARLDRSGQLDVLRNMIVEQKVIALITEHARFEAVAPESKLRDRVEAVDFFVAGQKESDIPDARYDDMGEPKKVLPGSSPLPGGGG